MEIFSIRLKKLRAEQNFSQEKVAQLLQLKQQSYLRYELNKGEPNLQTLVNIAKIFEVTTDYLLGLED